MSTSDGRATAVAHSNIALVKYWGKRDEELHLPVTGSLSLTLDAHPTTTTVAFGRTAGDEVVLNGEPATGRPLERVLRFLDRVRAQAGLDAPARVSSENTAPTAAGLASSAAGFAALAAAAAAAAGLRLSPRELSVLARKGSGSAARSVFGGLVLWHAGEDDASSYAEPVDAHGLDLAMVIALVDAAQKEVGSGEAMRRTVATSPFYPAWAGSCAAELESMLSAIGRADFTAIGELAEANALRMHATMLAAVPPVLYWAPGTIALLAAVRRARREGLECYATIDAGPNVKVLCRGADAGAVRDALRAAVPEASFTVAGPGPGVRLLETSASAGGA